MTREPRLGGSSNDPPNANACDWNALLEKDLADVHAAHLHRQRPVVRAIDAVHVEIAGRRFVNFCSNNYLGLTHHPDVIAAAANCIVSNGFGSGAAPLISGYTPAHASLEQTLAEWKGAESAVLLPSGYQANLAAVQTIAALAQARGGARFLLDKLVHASLIDAVRASGRPFRVFPHNQLRKLRKLLLDAQAGELQVVVTESIFSMDGDAADLAGIAELRKQFTFVWLLDEAHSTGVYGPQGAGLAAELGLSELVDIQIVTLSKALGGIGGAVCASKAFCDAVVNHGRAFIFSTSLPASVAAAAEAAVHAITHEPDRRRRLREIARHVREELGMTGDSPIIPIILGTETAALDAAAALREEGMLVGAVRPPTVPKGTSRLRVTVCSEHSDTEVDELISALVKLR
jgi:8-amino-7-oxononanoate synthase